MRILQVSLLLLTLVLLSSCGFKFRGQEDNNLKAATIIIVAENNYHPIVIGLNRKLLQLGAVVRMASEEDTKMNRLSSGTVIHLSKASEQRKILSVDDTSRALEYEFSIELAVAIKTITAHQNRLNTTGAPSTIFVRRVLVYDNQQLLAKSRERDQLRQEMYRVLVRQLIERLHAAKK